MIIDIDGVTVDLMDGHDRQVMHILAGTGYEHDSLMVWAKMQRFGAVALDIGAYTGLFSVVAAKCGARVTAFEPMPANHWRIRVNAARNKVQRLIDIVPAAASDYEGTAVLNYNPKVHLTTGASLEGGIPNHDAAMLVKCVTIDSLGLENVGAIKIDTERHEPCVLRGAMETIKRFRPPMLIETLDGDMRSTILGMLPDYEAATILDGRNTLFTPLRSPTCPKVQSQAPPISK
jgi:FkbM family methyltransferase